MKQLGLEDFLKYHYVGNLQASPNEEVYGFIKSKANKDKNTYDHTLYVGDEQGVKKVRKLNKNNQFTFLTDEVILIDYQKNKAEEKALNEASKQSFYTYNLKEKSLSKAFTLPIRAKVEAVIDDKTLLLSSMLKEADHVLYEGLDEQRKNYLKQAKIETAFEDIDELPYYFNGMGFKTDKQKQLFLYDVENDQLKRLLDKNFSVGTFSLSKDKKTIYYTGNPHQKVMGFTSKLYEYSILEDSHSTLYDQTDYSISDIILQDDAIYVAAKDMIRYGINENPDFYQVENNTLNKVTEFSMSMHNSVGTDVRLLGSDSSVQEDYQYLFVSTNDDHTDLISFAHNEIHTLYSMDGSIDGIIKFKNHYIITALTAQNLQEVYTLNIKDKTITPVTKFNKNIFKDTYIATPEEVVVKKDHHEVKGFVLLPKDYDETKTYPAILDIHGGPKTVYGKVFYHEMQYWANLGYIVMFANPRGSDGKGNEFADIRGKYGTIDYDDLMDFTDEVIHRYPAVDSNQLYVTGGSYGGFMTNWIVGHTDRFKAAATQRSISNWLSFYGTSDIGFYFAADQTAGHPIEEMDKLYEQSPIKYVRNVKTPLLFVHADKDHRCPIEQAQQFYAILKTQGLDTKLLWVKDENHELSRSGKPESRIKRLNAITDWFNKH